MSRLFSTFSNTVSHGVGDSNFLHDMVGESVGQIDRLVPTAIKQVSSEAISVAQNVPGVAGGLATGVVSSATGIIDHLSSEAISVAQKAADVANDVQIAGVVSSTGSGFMDKVSSEAISAAQGVATEVQHPAGLVSTASGFIKQVSSDTISAAQGVATDVRPAGLVTTASGFLNQVASEAILAAQKAPGVATNIQPGGLVSTASGFIKQVSSDAISVAQGVASEVRPAGLVGESVAKIDSLVPSVIKQVSSEAISAAQKATELQPAGLVSTASGFMKQVSSDAISAAQGVANELQPAGLVSNASGFIKQVSSDAISAAQGVAAKIQHPLVVKEEEEEQGLKYLAFVQVVGIHVVSFFTNLYTNAKQRSGPLKPALEFIEGIVKRVFQLVFAKYMNVPFELLKYFDGKVGEFVAKIGSLVPPDIKQVSSNIIWVAQKVLGLGGGVNTEVQHTGVPSNASGFINQISSNAISAIQHAPGLAGDMADQFQRAREVIELIQRLKNLASAFTKFYLYIKERLGPLKPALEFIERIIVSVFGRVFAGMVKSIFELVLEKYFGVPPELLKIVDGTLGESANMIGNLVPITGNLVPSVIGQISSEALLSAQNASGVALGVANVVQPAAVVSTASGFLNQVASDAISVAQKAPGMVTEVQSVGLVSTASGFFSQVASEALSVAQTAPGVATQVQPAGLVNTASGFFNQVTSEALSIAQKAPMMVTDVQPPALLSTASGFIKQVSSEAISAGQKAPEVATEVQPTGKGLLQQVTSEAISAAEEVATEVGVSAWRTINKIPLFPQVASVVVPTAAYFTKKYNQTVVKGAEKGFKVASYLPVVPIEKIAKVFSEGRPAAVTL